MPGPPVETQPGIALLMRYAARGPDQKGGFAARVSASPHGCLPGLWKRWRIQRSPARLRREAAMPFVVAIRASCCSHVLTRELMTLRNSGPPGTIGTVGTMVPRGRGGPRESRTTRPSGGHYLYESRDPRKTKGRAARPGSRQTGPASGRPLAHRDHGPDGPDGPEGVQELSQAASRPVSSFERRVPAFRGRRCSAPRDHRGRWSRPCWPDVAAQIEKYKPQ